MSTMIHTIENDHLKLSVRSSGAEMVSLRDKWNDVEYIWQGDPVFWARRSPVLFPVVGKLRDHKYRAEGREFKLPQHGIARDLLFDLISEKASGLKWKLHASEETLKVYPYQFELLISYLLQDRTVSIVYEVKNTDNRDILFSIGAHPGFNIPAFDYEKFEDYYLEFEKQETVKRYLLKEGLFTGETEELVKNSNTLDLSYDLFAKDAIVLKDHISRRLCLKSRKSGYRLDFVFDGFPYLGIWTAGKNAPFLCIEPWQGLADNINSNGELSKKEGIIRLPKGETHTARFSFHITS